MRLNIVQFGLSLGVGAEFSLGKLKSIESVNRRLDEGWIDGADKVTQLAAQVELTASTPVSIRLVKMPEATLFIFDSVLSSGFML